MPNSPNDRSVTKIVRTIEGEATSGDFQVRPLETGEQMALMEIHLEPGVSSALHAHEHESLIYVVRGRLKTKVGDNTYVMDPGDTCLHPRGVPHQVESLEETLFVEVKSPAPDIARLFNS